MLLFLNHDKGYALKTIPHSPKKRRCAVLEVKNKELLGKAC